MMLKQYRITTDKANVREEASTDSRVVITLDKDAVLYDDPERTADGAWLPVLLVKDGYPLETRRAWAHSSVVEAA